MGDFPKKAFDKYLTEPPEDLCEYCTFTGGECEDECQCEDCLTNRAEAWADARSDTYD